jgi:hypothetical protein
VQKRQCLRQMCRSNRIRSYQWIKTMWILPKNYPLSSAFAQDMVASKEDLTLLGSSIESSLMWRSKPSPSPTWLTRWKTDSHGSSTYLTRILKPSQRTSFEAALTLSLAATRASRFQQQGSALAPKTQDTSGPTSLTTSRQFDLFDASLKTSKGHISLGLREVIGDLEEAGYSATWGIFSAAEVGAPHQRKRVYILAELQQQRPWDANGIDDSQKQGISQGQDSQYPAECRLWPTPATRDHHAQGLSHNPASRSSSLATVIQRENAAQTWLTPTVQDSKHSGESRTKWKTGLAGEPSELANTSSQRFGGESQGQLQQPGRAKLSAQVKNWPTPNTWPTVRVSSANGASQKELQAGQPEEAIGDRGAFASKWPTPSAITRAARC